MCSRRSWVAERVAVAVAVAMAVACVAAGGSALAQGVGPQQGGANGGTFVERCIDQHKGMAGTLGVNLDIAAACACQAKSLREKGYDPETIDQAVRSAYMSALQNSPARTDQSELPGEGSIDAQAREKLRGGVLRIMRDMNGAFQACIRADIEKNAVMSMKKRLGLGS